MSWTRRDATALIRLLKKYNRIHGPDENVSATIKSMDWIANNWGKRLSTSGGPNARWISRDEDILRHLDWWCGVVEERYGMKRHTAITWLVKQYYDRLNDPKDKVFYFGAGTVDSIARRLGIKAKPEGRWMSDSHREKYEAIIRDNRDADIYQLTFKLLHLWQDPQSM